MTDAELPQPVAALTVDQALQQAIAQHQAGQLQDAERLYSAILQVYPNDANANHGIGVLAVQMKQPAAGLPHFIAALEADPTVGQYWLSYIDALFQSEQLEAARQVLAHAQQQGLQGEAVEALALRLEGATQVAAQSNVEYSPASEEALATLPTVLQPNTPPKKSKATRPDKPARKSLPHHGKSPGPQEINTLVALFTEGQYPEAAARAQAMTVRFPLHGFGWKVLGAVFKRAGRNAEALVPMQKAAALSPNDAETHNNLGVTLQDLGRLEEAEASYRRALQIWPDYAEAYSNLGNTFRDLGRLDEAEVSYQRALQIRPDYAEAHNNLGNTLKDLGRLDEAEVSYQRALRIKPDFAEAHNNLGVTLQDLGRLDEAEASYQRATQIQPDYAEAHSNLGDLLSYIGNSDQEISAYQKAFIASPKNHGLIAAVMLAVHRYLAGDFSECRNLLSASQLIMAKADAKFAPARAYWNLLDLLLSWNQKINGVADPSKNIETLYVIGESHSLPVHGVVVSYRGRPMRCVAQWIAGCKQWHLGNGKMNKYKYKFEMIMARLPQRSTILLTIGEIDCRLNEGITKVWRGLSEKSLDSLCQETSKAYLQYVAEISTRYGHRLVVCGVPAPDIQSEALTPEMAEQRINLVRVFNMILNELVLAAGMDFLDIYTLTDCGDGVASGEWHIDTYHLLPNAVLEAFDRHCLRSEAI